MKQWIRSTVRLAIASAKSWQSDNVPRLSAALAYYTIFSLVPLFIVVLVITGFFVDQASIQKELITQVQSLMGASAAEGIHHIINQAQKPLIAKTGTVVGIVGLLLGSLGVFKELKNSLNVIWKTPDKPRRKMKWYMLIWKLIRIHLVSFAMVLSVGFMLVVSLIMTSVLSLVIEKIQGEYFLTELLFMALNIFLSLAVTTVLFTLIFRIVPDLPVRWTSAWIGGITAAILFTIGKTLLALYLSHSNILTTFGAAGTLVLILVWVNYSSQVVFFGAEVSKNHEKLFR